MNTAKKRDYLFDNYRFLLIYLVVAGHFIEPCFQNNLLLSGIRSFIFSFHMPAFIFISGYFSKKTASLSKLIQNLLIPYFVYEIIYYLLYTYIIHKETKLYLAWPKFTLWYLIALFAWRIATPWIRKIPLCLPLAFLGGLLIGFSELDNFLSIPRIVYFYPFFLAGTMFSGSWVAKMRGFRRRKLILAVGFPTLLLLLFVLCRYAQTIQIFYGRYSYAVMGLESLEGILTRIISYAVSFAFTFAFMMLLPGKERKFSYMGQRTLPVYIFHGLLFQTLSHTTSWLSQISSFPQTCFLLVFCLFLVWLLSTKPFQVITEKISNIPIGFRTL